MKQIMILALGLFFSATVAFAQPPAGDDMEHPPRHEHRGPRGPIDHEKHAQKIISRLKEDITLTNAQEKEIEKILASTATEIKVFEAKHEPIREQVKAKLDALKESDLTREEKKEKMRAIKEKFKPEINDFREQMDEIRRNSKSQINAVLTTEQKAKLYEAMTERKFDKRKMHDKSKKRSGNKLNR